MSDFSSFSKTFTGDIVVPGNADYEASISRWATNAQRDAKIVAFVGGPEDVSLALGFAKASKLPIAIRGGGHSSSGASSSEGGLVIDLSRYLNKVVVDVEHKLARVGGGALWSDVDRTCIVHGLAAVAGTINHTGVGGLTLGGGFGWLSSSHGLVVDNLVEATIVTADGSIKCLSSSENEDLFWGIRGGGCNFGVVTEFVYKLHPQRKTVYAGTLIFPPTALESIVTITEKWWAEGPDEKEGLFHFLTRGPDGNPCNIVFLFYNGSEGDGRAAFRAILDLGPVVDTSKEIPYEELNSSLNTGLDHGRCTYMKGVRWTKPRVNVVSRVFDELIKLSAEKPEISITTAFEYWSLRKICSVSDDATACIRSPYCNVLTILRWDDNSEENRVFARAASRTLSGAVIGGNVELTDKSSAGYGNYDPEIAIGDSDSGPVSNSAEVLYGSNYARLQALKKKYDPEMVFSKWFAITPA